MESVYLEYQFKKPTRMAAWVFLVAGFLSIALTQYAPGIWGLVPVLIGLGAIVTQARTYLEYDATSSSIRIATEFFKLYRIGDWELLSDYPSITFLKGEAKLGKGPDQSSAKKYEVCLINKNGIELFLLCDATDLDQAKIKIAEIQKICPSLKFHKYGIKTT